MKRPGSGPATRAWCAKCERVKDVTDVVPRAAGQAGDDVVIVECELKCGHVARAINPAEWWR